jgi:hydrogenase maturation protein HypF
MTSGNRSDEPIVIENQEAFDSLAGIADYFLVHDREIYLRCDDSIVRQTAGNPRFIRRSRGYVPAPLFLKRPVLPILACGGGLKNTVCLTKENKAFLSRHIGDIENLATYDFFRSTIAHMKHILRIDPEMIAHDLHPDYLSTRYALEQQEKKKVPVQHHHAHIAACMAENMIDGPVIGLAFDGAGYGTDGHIWGGEVLIVEADRFTRAAHLSYVPMPGSNAAIREPWRMAVSYLYDALGKEFIDLDLPLLKKTGEKKLGIMTEMISKRVNSPLTSSMGRFFDGIAAIMGIRDRVSFEGQAAMELERLVQEKTGAIYDYEWVSEGVRRIMLKPIVRGVVDDMIKGVDLSEISGKFHRTLIRIFSNLCDGVRKESGLSRVALSGGVFQNVVLLTGMVEALEEKNFQVFTHTRVPANDGGLALGQAVVAAAAAGR